jgi:hypothetical protein
VLATIWEVVTSHPHMIAARPVGKAELERLGHVGTALVVGHGYELRWQRVQRRIPVVRRENDEGPRPTEGLRAAVSYTGSAIDRRDVSRNTAAGHRFLAQQAEDGGFTRGGRGEKNAAYRTAMSIIVPGIPKGFVPAYQR